MKLVIAGKNSIAVDVLEHAISIENLDIYIVLNRTENFLNSFQKSLGFYAKLWNVKVIDLKDAYDLKDAVFLSLEFDRIIKPILFKSQQLFNIHFSLLPAYKGMYTSALPILLGEEKTGVTLHKIDRSIDTGDIIVQKKIKISKNDTARSLYLKYIKKGTKLVIDNLASLLNQDFTAYRQPISGATYFGKKSIDYAHLNIDYNQTADQISKQLRAFSFREYQLPKFKEHEIGSSKALKQKSTLKPGQTVNETKSTIQIATIDYDILLLKDFYTKIWHFCKTNNFTALNELLMSDTKIDLEIKTKEGWTALIIAGYQGAQECVKLLIAAGSNVNASNHNLTTVLMYAKTNFLQTNNKNIIKLLLNNNADINQKDVYNKTVLDWTKEESTELYDFLKEKA